jgi:hypothetical protein
MVAARYVYSGARPLIGINGSAEFAIVAVTVMLPEAHTFAIDAQMLQTCTEQHSTAQHACSVYKLTVQTVDSVPV